MNWLYQNCKYISHFPLYLFATILSNKFEERKEKKKLQPNDWSSIIWVKEVY